jgi:hypothetical protein
MTSYTLAPPHICVVSCWILIAQFIFFYLRTYSSTQRPFITYAQTHCFTDRTCNAVSTGSPFCFSLHDYYSYHLYVWSKRVSECINTPLTARRPISECKCITLLQGWTQLSMSRNVIALQIHLLLRSEYGTTDIAGYSHRSDFFLVFYWILTT